MKQFLLSLLFGFMLLGCSKDNGTEDVKKEEEVKKEDCMDLSDTYWVSKPFIKDGNSIQNAFYFSSNKTVEYSIIYTQVNIKFRLGTYNNSLVYTYKDCKGSISGVFDFTNNGYVKHLGTNQIIKVSDFPNRENLPDLKEVFSLEEFKIEGSKLYFDGTEFRLTERFETGAVEEPVSICEVTFLNTSKNQYQLNFEGKLYYLDGNESIKFNLKAGSYQYSYLQQNGYIIYPTKGSYTFSVGKDDKKLRISFPD